MTSAATYNVWVDWNTSTATTSTYQLTTQAWGYWQTNPQPRWVGRQRQELTAKQRRKQAWLQARLALIGRNRERARALRQKIAMRKAETLLLEYLDDAQRREWAERNGFTVHTASGAEYFIRRGRAGNVYRVGGPRYCIHISDMVPDADNVLAQKLLLEANEAEFLRLANLA